jgi:hypothetical protein
MIEKSPEEKVRFLLANTMTEANHARAVAEVLRIAPDPEVFTDRRQPGHDMTKPPYHFSGCQYLFPNAYGSSALEGLWDETAAGTFSPPAAR